MEFLPEVAANIITGMVRQCLHEQQPVDSSLHPCHVHRLSSRLRLGIGNPDSTWIYKTFGAFRRLYRSLLRRSLHCRRLLHASCQCELQQLRCYTHRLERLPVDPRQQDM